VSTGPLDFAPRAVHDEYDVAHYDVDLAFDLTNRIVTGTVEVQATAQIANLSEIELDLYDNMMVDAVTAGGNPAVYSHANEVLTITLDGTYQVGQTFTVACSYHGDPRYPGHPFYIWWLTHGASVPEVLSYSEPYGSPAWWVCKDDPKDKATYDIHLTVPDDLYAVSSGVLDSETDNGNGTKTFVWITDYPMSPYLFSIAVTNYESWTETYTGLNGQDTMPVYYWAYPEDLALAQASWSNNIQMMEYYASIFGEYPFMDEKYAIAEFGHSGAMEHQTATSYGSRFVNGGHSNDYIVAHELSHSWVGDMITMTEWSHAWTKEGFATHCEALYFEDLWGHPYYHSYMNSLNPTSYGNYQLYGIIPPLHAAIYYKGAWVLHMLRRVIGDQAFFDGIYAYTNEPGLRYAHGDTEDLRLAIESEAGMDLTWFFDQWVYNPGFPRYSALWTPIPTDTGWDITLEIEQIQTIGPIFKMPIDVLLLTSQGQERFVVWDSLETQSFSLHVEGEPSVLALDPDRWIIQTTTVTTDVIEVGVPQPFFLSQSRPNPFGPSTTIGFSLAQPGQATLRIYDSAGRLTAKLLDGVVEAGPHQVPWDGRARDGARVAPGVYFYRLEAADRTLMGRMTLLK
jgi:aminopeptidase N